MKLEAIQNKVILEPIEIEGKTKSGIIIPRTAEAIQMPERAKVLSAGPGTKTEDMQLYEGDIVLFEKNSGMRINIGSITDPEEVIVLMQTGIHCKITEDAEG